MEKHYITNSFSNNCHGGIGSSLGISNGGDLVAVGKNNTVGRSARILALRIVLVFLFGTAVGSLLPETGNVLAYYLGMPYLKGHFFNPAFLVIGIIGTVLALFVGYKRCRK